MSVKIWNSFRTLLLTSLTGLVLTGPVLSAPMTYVGSGFAILDNLSNTSVVNVPDAGTVLSFQNVFINISTTHTFRSDLIAHLTSPNGIIVQLFPNMGGSADWIAGDYTLVDGGGATIPAVGDWTTGTYNILGGSYAAFIGAPSSGNWTLSIDDVFTQDQGAVGSWSITFDLAAAPEMDAKAASLPLTLLLGVGLVLGGKRRQTQLPTPS